LNLEYLIMATYAIGDIQGCFRTLQKLLKQIKFDQARDQLWLVGDLVNRGPHSLEVLRWAKSLGEQIKIVLGNHDLHLLARARGVARAKRKDTLEELLHAADRDELLDWLSHQPLFYQEAGYAMVHGGLAPAWSVEDAASLAREAEAALRSPLAPDLLATLSATGLHTWDPALPGLERLQMILRIFTRLRVCQLNGTMSFDFKGPPNEAPAGYFPWFEARDREYEEITIVSGHWAALGLHLQAGFIALDTACVWGGKLTAIRLEDRQIFQEPCADLP
jgi:bis(5'-nucleosyl)-tetraphosphatase (symmetrical)